MTRTELSGLTIGMLIFDDMTNLDFAGPYEIFANFPDVTCRLISKTLQPVQCKGGLKVIPDSTFADIPQVDLLFIPGGLGVDTVIQDKQSLDFVKAQGQKASYVTSVCTGALVLGAAGLLNGYKATTHWASMEYLPLFGAIPVQERVVIDRNRYTGGGVTAGIDFGLTIAAKLYGQQKAEEIQLRLEYNPQPPFNSGSPQTAPVEVLQAQREHNFRLSEKRRRIIQEAIADL